MLGVRGGVEWGVSSMEVVSLETFMWLIVRMLDIELCRLDSDFRPGDFNVKSRRRGCNNNNISYDDK